MIEIDDQRANPGEDIIHLYSILKIPDHEYGVGPVVIQYILRLRIHIINSLFKTPSSGLFSSRPVIYLRLVRKQDAAVTLEMAEYGRFSRLLSTTPASNDTIQSGRTNLRIIIFRAMTKRATARNTTGAAIWLITPFYLTLKGDMDHFAFMPPEYDQASQATGTGFALPQRSTVRHGS
jgi:hypothetical protein